MINSFFYPVFILSSILLPKDEKVWVFGHYNHYSDNTRYFFEYASSQSEFKCYWLANSNNELNYILEKGYKAVLKKSLKGYWLSSQASTTFICTGFSDVNRMLALKSNVINFWHGTPIKKIFLDVESKKTLMNFVIRKLHKALIKQTDFYYLSSEFERSLVSQASQTSLDKSIALGSPRFDIINDNTKSYSVLDKILNDNEVVKPSSIILYAPTWRDNNIWSKDFEIKANDYQALSDYLEAENAVFIIKPHPKSNIESIKNKGLLPSKRIIYSTELDINKTYIHIDILITDVSSAMFDFLILGKPIIIFMPDYAEYIEKNRGIYNYAKNMIFQSSITDWGNLIKAIKHPPNTDELLVSISKEVSKYQNTNKSIYQHIKDNFY